MTRRISPNGRQFSENRKVDGLSSVLSSFTLSLLLILISLRVSPLRHRDSVTFVGCVLHFVLRTQKDLRGQKKTDFRTLAIYSQTVDERDWSFLLVDPFLSV